MGGMLTGTGHRESSHLHELEVHYMVKGTPRDRSER